MIQFLNNTQIINSTPPFEPLAACPVASLLPIYGIAGCTKNHHRRANFPARHSIVSSSCTDRVRTHQYNRPDGKLPSYSIHPSNRRRSLRSSFVRRKEIAWKQSRRRTEVRAREREKGVVWLLARRRATARFGLFACSDFLIGIHRAKGK